MCEVKEGQKILASYGTAPIEISAVDTEVRFGCYMIKAGALKACRSEDADWEIKKGFKARVVHATDAELAMGGHEFGR